MTSTAAELADMFVHEVAVETCTGEGAYGPIFADPVDGIGCYVETRRQMVRDRTGAEVLSSTTIYAPPDRLALFTPRSIVHLPDHALAASAEVIAAGAFTSGALGLPDHAVINCT